MDLHWLPVCSRITYKIMVLTYRALNDKAPDYIKSRFTPYAPTRLLRSSDKPSLVAPHYNTKSYGARAFSVFAPTEYNALPLKICMAPHSLPSRVGSILTCSAQPMRYES